MYLVGWYSACHVIRINSLGTRLVVRDCNNIYIYHFICSESKKRRKDLSESTEEDGAPECKGKPIICVYVINHSVQLSHNLKYANYLSLSRALKLIKKK